MKMDQDFKVEEIYESAILILETLNDFFNVINS